MPSQKFIFGLALLAIILFGVNVKPELFGSIIKSFPTGLTGPSLACNSPDLFKEFRQRLNERIEGLKANVTQNTIAFDNGECSAKRDDPNCEKNRVARAIEEHRNNLNHLALHIVRTETLGQVENSLSCSMDYTFSEAADSPETFKFLLGRDDDGRLVWHYDQRVTPPYERPW